MFQRHPFSFFGLTGIGEKVLEAEAVRCFTLRGMIPWLACGTLLLALGCSRSSVNGKTAEPLSVSNMAPAETATALPRQTPAPDLRMAQPTQPAPPVPAFFQADIPVYPDGTVTKTETGPDGATLLLSTKKSWDHLMDFYTSALVPAGWKLVPTASPGQTLARFEKEGRVLVIQMQPGRQDEKLVRILCPTNSAQRP